MGTPQYMAPEQAAGKVDARSDVWGLGVTLYELLALRRAFDGATPAEVFEQVLKGEPAPPRRWVRNVPVDLAAICRKAMRKEPGERYATARAFAADVRRWLKGEVVEARGWQPARRVARWARRHKGWAAAITAMVLASLALLTGGAVHLEREARRYRLQQVLQNNRQAGWSREAWDLVKETARLGTDSRLQSLAVAALTGLDAEVERTFIGVEASTVAFDSTGKRVLFGGHESIPAHLWDGTEAAPRPSKLPGSGPVAFSSEGAPVQMVVDPMNRGRLIVWDVEGQRPIRTIVMPEAHEVQERLSRPPVMVMTTDARFLAAATGQLVIVWTTRTGVVVKRFLQAATALAITPDGTLLAVGTADGLIRVYGLPGGEVVADIPGSGSEVTALTFYTEVRRAKHGKVCLWGLVVGDAGSLITAYDLGTGKVRTYFRGTTFKVEALVCSPDNLTLASAGSGQFFLWDLATGLQLLQGDAPQ